MGEILFSVVVGGCLIASGILMIFVLGKEEKKVRKDKEVLHEYILYRSGCQHTGLHSGWNLGRSFCKGRK